MQFRTELHLPASPFRIGTASRLFTIGSCFSEVIGRQLHEHKLQTLVNPFGTIFNPISQFELIEAALQPEEQEELPMVQQNGRWYAYNFHSSFSDVTREGLQRQIDHTLREVREHLEKTDVVFFTFGTSLVYQLADSDRIVANCHKVPQSQFSKRMLLSEEVVAGFAQAFALLKQANPNVKVVLTVSPVRHLKETLQLNSVSKAVLRVACHYLAEMLPEVEYFPAYELLIDDLRDYRFYKDDLLHPSAMAEQYVWQKFGETYFDRELRDFVREWDQIRHAISHKPFHPESHPHQEFLQRLLARLQQLSEKIDCTAEIEQVRQQIIPPRKPKTHRKASQELFNLLDMLATADVMESGEVAEQPFEWPDAETAPEEEAARHAREAEEAYLAYDHAAETAEDKGEVDAKEIPEPEATEATQHTELGEPVAPVADTTGPNRERRPPRERPQRQPRPDKRQNQQRDRTPVPETTLPEPAQVQPVTAAAEQTPVEQPEQRQKVSKSKKRREKRKAKMLAMRESTQAQVAQPQEPAAVRVDQPESQQAVPATASPEQTTPAPDAVKGRPVRPARKPAKAAAAARPSSDVLASGPVAPIAPQPEAPAPEPAAAQPVKRGRKPAPKTKAAELPSQPSDTTSQPAATVSAEAAPPDSIPPRRKRPVKKSALAVGGLLSALAQAQPPAPAAPEAPAAPVVAASEKPVAKRGRPAKAPVASAPASETPPTSKGPQAENAETVAPKPKPARSRAKAKGTAESTGTLFNQAPEAAPLAPAPVPESTPPATAAKPAAEAKTREAKKENGGAKRGKAKKIVLKKTPAQKPGQE